MTIPRLRVVPASKYGKARRGFSLVELLVVIAIIAIIVAIVVPSSAACGSRARAPRRER